MLMPTAVGPHFLSVTFVLFLTALLACLTAVWIVNAGRAIDATLWKTDRLTATMDRRVGSDMLAASSGFGPSCLALYVVNATSPIKYAQEIPYAAVTTAGGTTGRNASPMSLAKGVSEPSYGKSLATGINVLYAVYLEPALAISVNLRAYAAYRTLESVESASSATSSCTTLSV